MWGLISFLIGIVYGWASPGRQNKPAMLRTGLIVGVVLAVIFAVLGVALGAPAIAIGVAGAVGIILDVLIVTLLFILGVWIGDMIEGSRNRRQNPRV